MLFIFDRDALLLAVKNENVSFFEYIDVVLEIGHGEI